MLRAIILDFDGVILESIDVKTRAFVELFKDYPQHHESIVRLHLQNAGMSRFEKFKIICQDYVGRPVNEDDLERLGEEFSRIVYREILHCPFVFGAYQFLDKHSEQYPMFIASAVPEGEIRDIVKQRDLERFFDGVYGSPRKKSEILHGILRENEFDPMQVVFIGDAVSDYHGAREVHIPFIGRVPRGGLNLFPEEGLVMTIENLYELDQQWSSVLEKLSRP